MTTGYPDWQGSSNATGVPIANTTTFALSSANAFSAQGWISSYPSARIRAFPSGSAQGCTVTISYYIDQTLTQLVGSYQWIIPAPAGLAVIVPNLGPYVVMAATTSTVTPFSCIFQLTPQITSCASPRYVGVGNEANMLNLSVPASATTSIMLPFVVEGPGHWTLYPRDAAAKLNCVVWEVGQGGGQARKIDEIDSLAAVSNRPLWGGNQGIALFVTNTDAAAAHALDARLLLDGR